MRCHISIATCEAERRRASHQPKTGRGGPVVQVLRTTSRAPEETPADVQECLHSRGWPGVCWPEPCRRLLLPPLAVTIQCSGYQSLVPHHLPPHLWPHLLRSYLEKCSRIHNIIIKSIILTLPPFREALRPIQTNRQQVHLQLHPPQRG